MLLQWILQRLFTAAVTVLSVACLVFLLLHLVPGDPVEAMLGESAHAADRMQLRHALGLEQPLWIQLGRFLYGVAHLDLGRSLFSGQPVTQLLAERLPATLELALAALMITLVMAIPLGVLAALRHGSGWDRAAMGFSLFGISVPNFWMGPMLILVFSVWLGWFPVSGRAGAASIVLPAITLGTALAAILARMLRSSLLEVLHEDYIRTARAKGLAPLQVIAQHALRNALLPVITLLGLQLGALLAGAVITETVFSWPGIGMLTVEAIQRRDYPVVQGCVLLISLSYVLVNLFTEFAYAWADPRIRHGEPP